tara:strand:- start:651 stop:824 length:174 start_codon:yes stop_codon:yes gene_type:complete
MSYQEKCELLYKNSEIMKAALSTIANKKSDITDHTSSVLSVKELKDIAKMILAVVDE